MDAVALLHRARKIGLRVEPMGDRLVVRGPKRAEAVVELLAAHKAEVLAALAVGACTSERGDQENATDAASANAGVAPRARHLSRSGSNHPALTEVSYDRG